MARPRKDKDDEVEVEVAEQISETPVVIADVEVALDPVNTVNSVSVNNIKENYVIVDGVGPCGIYSIDLESSTLVVRTPDDNLLQLKITAD